MDHRLITHTRGQTVRVMLGLSFIVPGAVALAAKGLTELTAPSFAYAEAIMFTYHDAQD